MIMGRLLGYIIALKIIQKIGKPMSGRKLAEKIDRGTRRIIG